MRMQKGLYKIVGSRYNDFQLENYKIKQTYL